MFEAAELLLDGESDFGGESLFLACLLWCYWYFLVNEKEERDYHAEARSKYPSFDMEPDRSPIQEKALQQYRKRYQKKKVVEQ